MKFSAHEPSATPSLRRVLKAALPCLLLSSQFAASASAAPLVIQEPNDPKHLVQWHLRDGVGIGAYSAWAMASTVPQTPAVVAVIDANVELVNTELKNRLVTGWDARNNQAYPVAFLVGASMHGTMVSGVLSGEVNNGYFGAGAAGPAPVKIMPLKYVNDTDLCGTGLKKDPATADQVFKAVKIALEYALSHNAKVINISSAVSFNRDELSDAVKAQYDDLIATFKKVSDQGTLIVAASGDREFDADRLSTESQIVIQGWDDISQQTQACPAPHFSIVKWESDLTSAQRTALTSGVPFDLTVTDALGSTSKVKVTARVLISKGSVILPAGLNRAPFNLNVLTVAGSDRDGKLWSDGCRPAENQFAAAMNDDLSKLLCSGSTYGNFVDIAAPAKEILVQTLGVELMEGGTSFSAPMVAGAAGLALSVRPYLTAAQLKAAITFGVDRTRIKPGATASATLNRDDLLNMPRMLASPTIGIANPNAPTRVDVLPEPSWNGTTRSMQFNATGTLKDEGGGLVSWAWNFGDNTPVTTTTSSTVSHAFALNGSYPVGLTVTDTQGNQRSFKQTFAAKGNTRDLVTLQLAGASPYGLNGPLVAGNLSVRNGLTPYQHVVDGTGVVRDASGKSVTVAFNVTTNLLGYVTTGSINITDPVRGKLSVTLSNGTLTYDGSIAQAVCSQSGLSAQTFTGVSFTVRDTDG